MGNFALAFVMLLILIVAANSAELSQADKDACKPDVFKFCAADVPFYPFDGGKSVFKCMEANRKQLSPACRATMRRHGV